MKILKVLQNRRGDAGYIELAVSLIISVILGGILIGAVLYIVNTSVASGISNQFVNEQDTVIQNEAVFNKEIPK